MRLHFDDFVLDMERFELRRSGALIKVDPLVLRMLDYLARNSRKVVSKADLIQHVWDGRPVSDNVITVAMVRLRHALGHERGKLEYIVSVRGRGYRFERAITRSVPNDAPQTRREPRPFVGREPVLAALRRAFVDADAGHGNGCVLTGDPGIGKTRVIEAFERESISSGIFVGWATSPPDKAPPPLWSFTQILRRLQTRARRRAAASDAAWAADYLQVPSMLAGMLAATNENSTPATAQATRLQLFDTIVELLVQESKLQTLVLVFDDLHRADAATLELLEALVDRLSRSRILLLATLPYLEAVRTDAFSQLSYLKGHRNLTRIDLAPLDEVDVTSYVRSQLSKASGEFTRELHRKSEGNPFFMTELVRAVQGGASPKVELSVSAAALELARRQLAALDAETRDALAYAAVIGRRFDLAVLQAVSKRPARSLMNDLDAAVTARVIRAVPGAQTSFTFAHELLRVALYESLLPAQRREYHLRLARALEALKPNGLGVSAAQLAFHFRSAMPATDLEKTVKYCEGAASEREADASAYAERLRHLRNAREALELMERPNPRHRLNLLVRESLLARVCAEADCEPLLRETLRVAREQEAGRQLAAAALLLQLNTGFPAIAGAREALEAALELLPPEDGATRAAVLARAAITGPLAFDDHASAAQLSRALELASASETVLAVYIARASQLFLFGAALDPTPADDAMRALEELCTRNPRHFGATPVLLDLHRAIRLVQSGSHDEVQVLLDRCEATCRKLGAYELGWYVERAGAIRQINTGDVKRGRARLEALHRNERRAAPPGSLVFRAYDQCVVSPAVSNLSRADLAHALRHDKSDAPNIWAIKVRALASAGLHDEAKRQLALCPPERIALLPRDRDLVGTLGALARAALDLRTTHYIAPLRARLSEYTEQFCASGAFYCEGAATSILDELGRASQARDAYH